MPSTDHSRPRASKACVICHKKKIRCDLDNVVPGQRCSNCTKDGYQDCIARERKRKRYSAYSPSPPRDTSRRRDLRASTFSSDQRHVEVPAGINSPTALPGFASLNAHLGATPTHNAISSNGASPLPPGVFPKQASESPLPIAPALQPPLTTNQFSPTGGSYLGRSEYIGAEVPIDDEPDAPQSNIMTMSERDTKVLQIQKVRKLPPRSLRDSLLDGFWRRCYPWTPIVERSWLEDHTGSNTSMLLLQSTLLAGSRVSSDPQVSSHAEDFYKKAKTLFWMGAEKDPLLNIVSVCLLNWWNPQSPEHISIDTSSFWLRIAIGLCYQVGLHREPPRREDASLRRRIWWSLVVRDNLINAGHGRPRSVDLNLTTTALPTVEDFQGDERATDLFLAYVGISLILGDLTTLALQNSKKPNERSAIENRVYRWIHTLPEPLRLYPHPSPEPVMLFYNFEARQLHVQYFTVLVILHKSRVKGAPPSTAALLASSFVAGIFEEFLERDEVQYLGPIFTFYLLVCGVAQLSCYKYAGLWHLAEQDLQIIFRSQEELAKRWPSAVGSLKSMSDVREAATQRQCLNSFPENNLTGEQRQFFAPFGHHLCRQWGMLYEGGDASHSGTRDLMTAGILQDLRTPGTVFGNGAAAAPDIQGLEQDARHDIEVANVFLNGAQGGFDQYGGMGNWLLNGWDGVAPW